MSTKPEPANQSAAVMRDMLDRMLREMGSSGLSAPSHAAEPAYPAESAAPCETHAAPAPKEEARSEHAELPPMVCRAYHEISAMLHALRSSRDALEQATTEKLHLTSAKLEEVTSATEVAATGMLDGLDRALVMVDELDELDTSGSRKAADTRSRLRDELFQSINFLQFQDITTQQLNYASSVLTDIENRLAEIVKSFDPASIAVPGVDANGDIQILDSAAVITFDPDASLCNAECRQAIADEIFARLD